MYQWFARERSLFLVGGRERAVAAATCLPSTPDTILWQAGSAQAGSRRRAAIRTGDAPLVRHPTIPPDRSANRRCGRARSAEVRHR